MLYFVYELYDKMTNEIGYVGITNNPNQRHLEHAELRVGKGPKNAWIMSLLEKGTIPGMRILESGEDKEEIRKLEKYWIQHYISRGVNLRNIHYTNRKPSDYGNRTNSANSPQYATERLKTFALRQMQAKPQRAQAFTEEDEDLIERLFKQFRISNLIVNPTIQQIQQFVSDFPTNRLKNKVVLELFEMIYEATLEYDF